MDTATTANVKNKLMKPTNGNGEKKQPATLKDWVLASMPEIKKALPNMMDEERFVRIAITALSTTPKLQECDPTSFCIALLQSAQLGLEPNTPLGQAYLIPYGRTCQFQLGYKGVLTLAYRTKEFEFIDAQVVCKNDEFEFEYGLDRKLRHKPAKRDRGEAEWYYAVYKLQSGGSGFAVMSIEDVVLFAKKYSKAFDSKTSPWQTAFDEMAKKTCIKKALKYAPTSVEFQKALVFDGAVKKQISSNMLDVPGEFIETDYTVTEEEESKKEIPENIAKPANNFKPAEPAKETINTKVTVTEVTKDDIADEFMSLTAEATREQIDTMVKLQREIQMNDSEFWSICKMVCEKKIVAYHHINQGQADSIIELLKIKKNDIQKAA